MSYLLLVSIIFAFVLLFIFYGLRKQEEYNERKVVKDRRVGSELYDYYLDIIEYVTTGYYEDAKKLLKEVVDKNPDEYPAYLLLSYILRRQGMPEKALNIDKTIYANEKLSKRGKFAILKSLLVDYVENGMYKTALNAIENNKSAFKNDEFLLSLAKDVSYRLGDFEKALAYNKKLLDFKNIKDHSELGYIAANMAQQALENENYDIVKNLIKKGKKFNKNCESIYLAEAKLNYDRDNLSKAKSLFMKALNINPDIIDYISDDILNVYAQNYDDLIKDLNKVVKNNLYNPYIHIFLAKIYRKNENLEEAIEELHEAILYKPESHYILLLMLDVYIEMGDWEKVVEMKEELKDLESSRKFVCKECGKKYHEPTWYCDKCRSWGKVVTKL